MVLWLYVQEHPKPQPAVVLVLKCLLRRKTLKILSDGLGLFVCFVALRPKSTAMVMAGRSVHLTTLFSWASLNKQLTSTSCTYFLL